MPAGNEDEWQLFIYGGMEGNTMTISINKHATTETFFKKLSEKYALQYGFPVEKVQSMGLRILFGCKQLVSKKDIKLTDYGLQNNSTVSLVLRLPGGSDQEDDSGLSDTDSDLVSMFSNAFDKDAADDDVDDDEKPTDNGFFDSVEFYLDDYQVKQLDPDVPRTDAPDMITWDDDKDNLRAKMPCGHAIGPESLTMYCRNLLDKGRYRFFCPYIDKENKSYCGEEWEYITVRRIAVLKEDEKKDFEISISRNYMRRACGIQDCPRCESFCERENKTDRRVVCPFCTLKDGICFEFCWYCLGEWRTLGIKDCGNPVCTNEDPRLKILKDAEKKSIVGVKNCPSRRACIKCGMIIEHEEACKHMVCICGQRFCFICLKPPDNGHYQCGFYYSPCTVAPVQTSIPGDN